jgi:hypothetical protein
MEREVFLELLLLVLDFVTLEYQEIQDLLKDLLRHHRRYAILLQFLLRHQQQGTQQYLQKYQEQLHQKYLMK